MRPGQETPDEVLKMPCLDLGGATFNEAGARNPG